MHRILTMHFSHNPRQKAEAAGKFNLTVPKKIVGTRGKG